VAVTPDGSNVYVANQLGTVSVIGTATNTVVATIPIGNNAIGVAITPDGTKVYVASFGPNTVSVIATATNTVVATIPVGTAPVGVAVTPDGSKVYVTNRDDNNVSVITVPTPHPPRPPSARSRPVFFRSWQSQGLSPLSSEAKALANVRLRDGDRARPPASSATARSIGLGLESSRSQPESEHWPCNART
jgi:YVTN family beta-propeller protein